MERRQKKNDPRPGIEKSLEYAQGTGLQVPFELEIIGIGQ